MKYLVALFLGFILVQHTQAQDKKDANDYFITTDGERVDIAIETRKINKKLNFLYKDPETGRTKRLRPNEISEFRDFDKRYISKYVRHNDKKYDHSDDIFLEEIVAGKVSYYYSKDTKYKDYLSKDGEFRPLFREFVAQTNVNTPGGSFYVNRYLDVYYEYFGDCESFDYTKKYRLGKKRIKKVVETYNGCFENQ